MADKTNKTVVVTPLSTNGLPVAPPPIHDKIFIERHPTVVEKDKSTHSEHGLRLQTQHLHYPNAPIGMIDIFAVIWKTEGIPGLWKGLTASMTRNAVYSGVRFGLYENLKESATTPTHAPAAITLAGFAATSGALGSIISNPADIVCLRMQNDPGMPREHRRNYRNVADGILKMSRNEGISSLFTGVWVGAGRAAIATATQLAGYDVIKRELMKRTSMTDSVPTHITASCLAGFLSTFICSPLDVFKARLMTIKSYHSISTMLTRIFKTEGFLWMFHGLTPALISRAPSTIITFVTLEQLRRVYRNIHGLEE
ncbi:hypothetical protein MBLNU457_g2655t2 [Dothideomycetes sp. NU457]